MTVETDKPSFFDKRGARVLTVGLSAAIFYSAWAVYSNWDFGFYIASKAAAVQGATYSLSVLCSASLMETLFKVSSNFVVRFLTSSLGSGTIIFFGFLTFHIINGTPNIFMTMLPPIVIAIPYYILYPLELARREMVNNPENMTIKSKVLKTMMMKLAKSKN